MKLPEDSEAAEARRRRLILTDTVAREVIPRLLRRHEAASESLGIDADQVVALADLALHADGEASVAFVTALLHDGVAAELLYLGLLSPAAALLGQYWEDDVCNFADVTVGMVHLQSALRALGPAFFAGRPLPSHNGPRVMLLPLPGEQHTFGLQMLADFFQRAGFDTWTGRVATTTELQGILRAEWVDLVGFSVGCSDMLDVARREVESVRRSSRNPAVVVMVGGPPFVADPDLVKQVGADGTAQDGMQAVGSAEALLRGRPRLVQR